MKRGVIVDVSGMDANAIKEILGVETGVVKDVNGAGIQADNPVLPMVKEVRQTTDVKEVAAIMAQKTWVVIAAAMGGDGKCPFALGRVC